MEDTNLLDSITSLSFNKSLSLEKYIKESPLDSQIDSNQDQSMLNLELFAMKSLSEIDEKDSKLE